MATHQSVASAPNRRTQWIVAGVVVLISVAVGFFIIRSQAATIKPGDLDGDGKVTNEDLRALSKNLNRKNVSASEGDMDGDGDVDITDLSIATTKIDE